MKHVLLVLGLLAPVAGFTQDQSPQEVEAPKAQVFEQGDKLVIQIKQNNYSVLLAPSSRTHRDEFDKLPQSIQNEFHHNRQLILKLMAQALSYTKFAAGIGGIAKDKVVWVKDKVMAPLRMPELADFTGPLDWYNTQEAVGPDKKNSEKVTLSQRGHQSIQTILQAVDRSLWSQAELVAHSNEYSLMVAAAPTAEGGKTDKGYGGHVGAGLSIGYNKETKAFVFQIFQHTEKFESTLAGLTAYLGLTFKVGLQVAENSPGREHLKRKGHSFYPPAAPGFATWTPDSFTTGLSSGLGLPPPPFGDVLTYQNEHYETTFLRITISPLLKGFVRFQSGIDVKPVLQPITDVYHKIRAKVFGVGLCQRVHLN